jgi:hypothetical protein
MGFLVLPVLRMALHRFYLISFYRYVDCNFCNLEVLRSGDVGRSIASLLKLLKINNLTVLRLSRVNNHCLVNTLVALFSTKLKHLFSRQRPDFLTTWLRFFLFFLPTRFVVFIPILAIVFFITKLASWSSRLLHKNILTDNKWSLRRHSNYVRVSSSAAKITSLLSMFST